MPIHAFDISWASERHLRIEVGHDISPTTHARVQAVVHAISHADPRSLGILDIIPAYATVLLSFNRSAIIRDGPSRIESAIRHAIDSALSAPEPAQGLPVQPSRLLEIPVCYAPAFALDLADVATMHALSPSDVIRLHTGAEYVVHFVGFSPGFAYLGGLPKQLETPRLDRPRVRVPPGSVAIAGSQAGVYPHATPGGWRILGRTPLRMFDATRQPPALLQLADRVRFVEIGEAECERMEREHQQIENERAVAQSTSVGHGSKPTLNPSLGEGPLIRVLTPGLFTTIQDLGRPGHAAQGVPPSGAADPTSLRLANHLLVNDHHAAALELTLLGGEYEFSHDTQVCLAGADMPATILSPDGTSRNLPQATPTHIHAGERLRLAFARSGARAYLAIRGGLEAPLILGSRSTLSNVTLGGLDGRALKPGDTLRTPRANLARGPAQPPRHAQPGALAQPPTNLFEHTLHVVPASHTSRFATDALATFASAEFTVSSHSDRMGLRLQGPRITPPGNGRLLSEGMMWGAIQVTESGQPIILLPDHPTTGGYPVIACVIAADLPKLGQLRPNDRIRFEIVTLDHARAAWTPIEHGLARSHA